MQINLWTIVAFIAALGTAAYVVLGSNAACNT